MSSGAEGLSCRDGAVVLLRAPFWKEGRRVDLQVVQSFFHPLFLPHAGSQVAGREPSSTTVPTEGRHQPPSTNCFGSRPR